MKGIRIHERGGPEQFEDAPKPVPGRGDVVVRVVAATQPAQSFRRQVVRPVLALGTGESLNSRRRCSYERASRSLAKHGVVALPR
jgi:hypothetical protein